MPPSEVTDQQLLGWLDEALEPSAMTEIERTLRNSEALRARVSQLLRRRDQGQHTVGEIWRRRRLSCPSRSQLGSYLLGTLDSDLAGYVEFHLQAIACRYCAANLQDLEEARDAEPESRRRREKIFQSSAGYLRPGESPTQPPGD